MPANSCVASTMGSSHRMGDSSASMGAPWAAATVKMLGRISRCSAYEYRTQPKSATHSCRNSGASWLRLEARLSASSQSSSCGTTPSMADWGTSGSLWTKTEPPRRRLYRPTHACVASCVATESEARTCTIRNSSAYRVEDVQAHAANMRHEKERGARMLCGRESRRFMAVLDGGSGRVAWRAYPERLAQEPPQGVGRGAVPHGAI